MNCSGDSCGSVSGSVRGFLGVTGGAEAISILDDGLDNVAGGFGFRGGRPEPKTMHSESNTFTTECSYTLIWNSIGKGIERIICL